MSGAGQPWQDFAPGSGASGTAPTAQSGPWSDFSPQAPTAAPSPSETSSPGIGGTIEDMARAVPGGLAQGVAAVAGLPGDMGRLEGNAASWLAGKINPDLGKDVQGGFDWANRNVTDYFAPTSEEINAKLSAPTGGYYQPKTTAGRIAETAASFAPAAFGGEGSIASRVLGRVAVPAATSVLGGDAAKAAGLPERVGSIPGALVGSLLGSLNPKELLASLQNGSIAPAVNDLKASARQAYQTVDNSGMVISQPAFSTLMDSIKSDLAQKGFHPKLQPKTAAALDAMDQTAANLNPPSTASAALPGSGGTAPVQGVTLQGMDVLRRIAQHATDPLNKSDTMMSRRIVDNIDNFVQGLTPSQVVGNVDQPALDALSNARDLWSRAAKGDQINALIDKARLNSKSMVGNFPALGFGNALRTEFRKLANNPRGMARFAPAEQDAITRVATGSPAENILRLVGKLSPDQTIPMLSEFGAAAVDPKMLALPVAGLIGKAGATDITARNANLASALVRNGRSAVTPTRSLVTAPNIQGLLAQPYIASTIQNNQQPSFAGASP